MGLLTLWLGVSNSAQLKWIVLNAWSLVTSRTRVLSLPGLSNIAGVVSQEVALLQMALPCSQTPGAHIVIFPLGLFINPTLHHYVLLHGICHKAWRKLHSLHLLHCCDIIPHFYLLLCVHVKQFPFWLSIYSVPKDPTKHSHNSLQVKVLWLSVILAHHFRNCKDLASGNQALPNRLYFFKTPYSFCSYWAPFCEYFSCHHLWPAEESS